MEDQKKAEAEAQNKVGRVSLLQGVFEICFYILEFGENSKLMATFFTIVHTLQIMYFAFHPALMEVWGGISLAESLQKFLGYLNLVQIYRESQEMTILVIFYLFVFLVFVFSMLLLSALFKIQANQTVPESMVRQIQFLLELFLSVLFVPMTACFSMMFACKHGNENTENACWSRVAIVHNFVSVIAAIFLLALTLLFSSLYFDGIYSEERLISKRTSHDKVAQVVCQFLLILLFTVFDTEIYQSLLVIIFFAASIIQFYMTHIKAPYNNPYIQKLQSFASTIQMWLALMLLLALSSEKKVFNGVIFAFVLGLPVNLGIVIWQPERNSFANRMMKVNKFDSPLEIIEHCNYVQRLVTKDLSKDLNGQLLNGYIEFHNKTCLLTNCPLKQIRFQTIRGNGNRKQQRLEIGQKNRVAQSRQRGQGNHSETHHGLEKKHIYVYQMLQQLYEFGLVQYPTNILIKIYFSVFMFRVMNSKQHALSEIQEAEKFKSQVDEQFTLFQIKRKIELSFQEASKEGLNFQDMQNMESYIAQFRSSVEQTTTQLMEFWLQLSEDNPDLIKLMDLSQKLLPLKQQVDKMWIKVQQAPLEKLYSLIKFYSQYCSDILNDQRLGQELLARSQKIEEQYKSQRLRNLNISSESSIDGIEIGYVIISMEDERLGQVVAINPSALNLLGLSRGEIFGKNVSTILPQLHSPLHHEILLKYLETNVTYQSGNPRELWVRNGYGYLVPIQFELRQVYHNMTDQLEFFARIQRSTYIKHQAHVLLDTQFLVTDISAHAINLLGLEATSIRSFKIQFDKLVPEFEEFVSVLQSEQPQQQQGVIQYTFPKITQDEVQYQRGTTKIRLNLQIQAIRVQHLNGRLIGYLVKAEPRNEVKKKLKQNDLAEDPERFTRFRVHRHGNLFSFKLSLSEQELIYQGNFMTPQEVLDNTQFPVDQSFFQQSVRLQLDGTSRTDNDGRTLIVNTLRTPNKAAEDKSQDNNQLQHQSQEKIDWGRGIKIVRYMNGAMAEIENQDSDAEEDEDERIRQEEKKNSESRRRNLDKQQIQLAGQIISRDLNIELLKREDSDQIRRAKVFSWVIFLTAVVLVILEYQLKLRRINNQKNNLDLIVSQSNQFSDLQQILALTSSLVQSSEGIRIPQYTNVTGQAPTALSDQGKLREYLLAAIASFNQKSIEIFEAQKSTSQNLEIFFNLENSSSFDLDYVTRQITSRSSAVVDLPLSQILDSNPDIFFNIFNGLNGLAKELVRIYSLTIDSSIENIRSLRRISEYFIWITISFSIVSGATLLIFFLIIIKSKVRILQVFLELPEKTARYMNQKCIVFLQQFLEGGENEELITGTTLSQQLLQGNEEHSGAGMLGKKRKRFKNNQIGVAGQLSKIFVLISFIIAYFLFNHFQGAQSVNNMQRLMNEFNQTVLLESYFSFSNNAHVQTLRQNSWTIIGEPSNLILPIIFEQMQMIDERNNQEHAKNTEPHKQSNFGYLEDFDLIMFRSPCDILVSLRAVSVAECAEFSGGLIQQGMVTANVRFSQNLRYLGDKFEWIQQNPTQDVTLSGYTLQTLDANNKTRNNLLNLQRCPEIYENEHLQLQYIKFSMRYLQQRFNGELQGVFDQFSEVRLILIIVFLSLFIFIYLLYWIPSIQQLNQELWAQKSLLTFIPVEDMASNYSIAQFIRERVLKKKI